LVLLQLAWVIPNNIKKEIGKGRFSKRTGEKYIKINRKKGKLMN